MPRCFTGGSAVTHLLLKTVRSTFSGRVNSWLQQRESSAMHHTASVPGRKRPLVARGFTYGRRAWPTTLPPWQQQEQRERLHGGRWRRRCLEGWRQRLASGD
mmetsp:Transcript_71141/g.206342  ORF Transcript_71141/g.206342 Transcript_71141/m.206342 type:complete len:102 (+) Transcript_71141:875-1180(+)